MKMAVRFTDKYCSHEYTYEWDGKISMRDLSEMLAKILRGEIVKHECPSLDEKFKADIFDEDDD